MWRELGGAAARRDDFSLLQEELEELQDLQEASADPDAEEVQPEPRHLNGVVKVAVLGLVSVGLVYAALVSGPARQGRLRQAEVGQAVGLQQVMCHDAPGWTNGFSKCNENGYSGVGCTPTGLTCEAYRANGWCVDGMPVKAWAIGADLNSPELHCCVCGGGSETELSAEDAAEAAKPALPQPPQPPFPPKSADCSLYSLCVLAKLEGSCCPTEEGITLGCCSSPLVCRDTPGWNNGYTKCSQHGFTEEHGCTPEGVTCAGYVNQSFCADGRVVPGKEWTLGASFNYPEQNCCACGKPPGL